MPKEIEEVIQSHVTRLTENPDQMKPFFNGGIAIQNDRSNWDADYLANKMHITCETLCQVGFCNSTQCETCAMTAAHDRALEEIQEGLRKQGRKVKRVAHTVYNQEDYYCYVSVDKRTGIITQVLRPIKKEDK